MTYAVNQKLSVKTYPAIPDDWCETTVSPPEGGWSTVSPLGAYIELATFPYVGSRSVKMWATSPCYYEQLRFTLNSGREFDGTKDQAQIHAWIALQSGVFDGLFRVWVYDASGRRAYKEWYVPVGQYFNVTLDLGAGKGWTELDAGFDWRFIGSFDFWASTGVDFWGTHYYGALWVDEVHFSYYELELGKLTILSEPALGVQFRIEGNYYVTPQYNLGLLPNTNYAVATDPTNFLNWENGDPSPSRTISLAEAESKTIIAYYSTPPPPPDGDHGGVNLAIVGAGLLLFVGSVIAIRYLTTRR